MMEKLMEKYLEEFGYFPWAFRSMSDEEMRQAMKKALEKGKPVTDVFEAGVDY